MFFIACYASVKITDMKEVLSILGIILLVVALTLQIAIDQPLITILLLWIYVIVRNVQSLVE